MTRERPTLARRGFLSGLASTPLLASAAVLPDIAQAAPADPIPALYVEKVRVCSLLREKGDATDAEGDALADAWGACDAQAIGSPATTIAGASVSIQWVREELMQFGFAMEPEAHDKGARLILALIDGALSALRTGA